MVGSVLAPDADVGSNGDVMYLSSPQELVTVDNVTGEVVLLVLPDFETISMHSVQVIIAWSQQKPHLPVACCI